MSQRRSSVDSKSWVRSFGFAGRSTCIQTFAAGWDLLSILSGFQSQLCRLGAPDSSIRSTEVSSMCYYFTDLAR